MGLKIYGIDVEETQYDDALFIQFWEEFLTGHLQQFSQPDIIELAPEDGEYELAFERAVRSLIDEDIFVSEQWLKAIELAVHIPDYWESSFFSNTPSVYAPITQRQAPNSQHLPPTRFDHHRAGFCYIHTKNSWVESPMDTATTTADNSDAHAEDDLENHKLQLRESESRVLKHLALMSQCSVVAAPTGLKSMSRRSRKHSTSCKHRY